jgi:hypothetical protein
MVSAYLEPVQDAAGQDRNRKDATTLSGYTPVFDTVYDGTLCGKWPTLPVWLSILPMADKNGLIEMTYQAISARTGWPLELLKQGIAELMAPDPESRTAEREGRRLELIDEHRNWGWRVINHGQYRNKARKAAYDADRTASGADAERKRQERASRGTVPTRPDASRHIPPSDSDSDTNSDTNILNVRGETEADIRQHILLIKARWPKGCAHEDWITAEKLIRNLVTAGESWDAIEAGVERYAKHCKATNRLVKNPSRWFADISRPWLSPWTIPPKPGEKQAPNHDAAWAEAKAAAKDIGFREPFPTETVSGYATAVKQAINSPLMPPLAERIGLAGIKRVAK